MMQKTKKELTPKKIMTTLDMNRSDLKKYGVKKIGLFGSYIKGKQHKTSDLDFLVDLKNYTFDDYIELKFFLEKLFHKKVDLVIEKDLKPSLQYVKGEALYAKEI